MGFGETTQFGAAEDYTDKKASKSIVSKNIERFYLSFFDMRSATVKNTNRFYEYFLIKKEDKCLYHCEGGTNSNIPSDRRLESEVFGELQGLIEDNNLAAFNGHSKRDTALGARMTLKVDYSSKESIFIYCEGSSATFPFGFSVSVFSDFLEACDEKGEKIEDISEIYVVCPCCKEKVYIGKAWCGNCGADIKQR
ncbi:MAG: hypothetical protein GX061_01980 [Eubacteriaceae bacterium]|nr:hypothetical protein [Eubacteriaceae bacterium]